MKRSASVTPADSSRIHLVSAIQLNSLPLDLKALPLSWILGPKTDSLAERVLARLIQAEAHEANPHFRADIRISWIAVKWASDGIPEWSPYRLLPPHVAATFAVLNCHPDEVWPRILQTRQEKLGAEYSEWYDASGMSRPDIPKKPQSPVTTAPQPQAVPFPKESRRA